MILTICFYYYLVYMWSKYLKERKFNQKLTSKILEFYNIIIILWNLYIVLIILVYARPFPLIWGCNIVNPDNYDIVMEKVIFESI